MAEEQTAEAGTAGPALDGAAAVRAVLLRAAEADRGAGGAVGVAAVADGGGGGDRAGAGGGGRHGAQVAERPAGDRGRGGTQGRGILAERAGTDGVVIGVGINVTLKADELPVPQAGSLALAGARGTDRDPLLRAVLRALEDWYGRWRAVGGRPCGVRVTGDVRRAARRSGGWCGPSCRGTGRWWGRPWRWTGTGGWSSLRRKGCRSRWGGGHRAFAACVRLGGLRWGPAGAGACGA